VDGVTGDWYCKFDTFHPAVDNGLPVTRVISRVTLQGILAGGLPESAILNNCKVARYEEDSDGVTAVLEDGTRIKGDVLVGADGTTVERRMAHAKPVV
jgi:zeaxanthin epoxidase